MAHLTSRRLWPILALLACFSILYWTFRDYLKPGLRTSSQNDSARQILIVTMNTKETSYDILSLSNKNEYARRHNYELKVDFAPPDAWHKIDMVEDGIKLEKYDWIWWIDFDTLITNTSVKLTDIIDDTLRTHPDPDNIDLIFTPDCFPMNSGSMLFRASPRVLGFLSLTKECRRIEQISDQDCIGAMMGFTLPPSGNSLASAEWIRRRVMIPQKTMNAFPKEIACWEQPNGHWQQGDFVIHFAGAWAHLADEKDPTGVLMQKYRNSIVHS